MLLGSPNTALIIGAAVSGGDWRRLAEQLAGVYMHVEFTEEVTVTGTASVSIEDITIALKDSLDQAEYAMETSDNARTKIYLVQRFVSDCFQCMSAITEEMIAEVPEANRQLIYAEFQQHVDRWAARLDAASNSGSGG